MSSVRKGREYGDGSEPKSTSRSVSNSKSLRDQMKSGKLPARRMSPNPTTKTTSTSDPDKAKYDKRSNAIHKKSTHSRQKKLEGKEKERENRHGTNEKATTKDVREKNVKKNAKEDKIYLKDVLEKKALMRHREEKRREMEAIEDEVQRQINEAEMTLERSKIKRDRTRTRTLSPTEIKQLIAPKKTESDERLNGKGSATVVAVEEPTEEEKDEYESDFEDYESDFEDDESESSVQTNQRGSDFNETDSSTGESQKTSPQPKATAEETLTEKEERVTIKPQNARWREDLQMRHLKDIKNCIEKENTEITEKRKSIAQPMVKAEEKDALTEGHLIDFSMASKKQKTQKEANAAKKRGRELLNMITLDAVTYNILEIPPTPYDVYMRAFGKSNTKQVYVQTNDDVLEEEVQTVEIKTSNKWTQHPVDFLGKKMNGDEQQRYVLTKEERLGVGTDDPEELTKNDHVKDAMFEPRTSSLHEFLSWAGQVVLEALERRSSHFLSLEKMPHNDGEMAFADGFIRLNTDDVSPLAGKSVTDLCLVNKTNKKLLAVHLNKNKNFQNCILSVWSLGELSKPLRVLAASNRVTSCTFGPNQGNPIVAGLSDGTLCLWDLREPLIYHDQHLDNSEYALQHPTYTTAGDLEENNHSTSVVSVRLVSGMESSERDDDFSPLQLCSLDGNGIIVVWSVIQLEKSNRVEPSSDLGLSHWGKLKLVKSSSFTVFDNLKNEAPNWNITFNDLLINEAEDDGFYVANSAGRVHHLSTYGSPMKPKFYLPSKRDFLVEATCLEMCPFDGNYFLVGCGDGSIRLHSRHQEHPLITLHSNVGEGERQTPIVTMCWLNTRPCVIFSLDSKSRIRVWDLAVSDMYPEMTIVPNSKKILSMKLLTDLDANRIPFIVAGMEDGSVEIHRVRKDYGRKTAAETVTEKKMFLRYVSIL